MAVYAVIGNKEFLLGSMDGVTYDLSGHTFTAYRIDGEAAICVQGAASAFVETQRPPAPTVQKARVYKAVRVDTEANENGYTANDLANHKPISWAESMVRYTAVFQLPDGADPLNCYQLKSLIPAQSKVVYPRQNEAGEWIVDQPADWASASWTSLTPSNFSLEESTQSKDK